MSRDKAYSRSVFVNYPVEREYTPFLEAIIYTSLSCGFRPVMAIVENDGGTTRLEKIKRQIASCRFGIHDISRMPRTRRELPRFNMPFELGLDIGAQTWNKRDKKLLILDTNEHRYLQTLSDIRGQDINAYTTIADLIPIVRNWLSANTRGRVHGPVEIARRFRFFTESLPELCGRRGLDRTSLPADDYIKMAYSEILSYGE